MASATLGRPVCNAVGAIVGANVGAGIVPSGLVGRGLGCTVGLTDGGGVTK